MVLAVVAGLVAVRPDLSGIQPASSVQASGAEAGAIRVQAPRRQVAITIDDLPRGGDGGGTSFEAVRAMTERLMRPFREGHVPVIGFVNQHRGVDVDADGLRRILDIWLDAGADLGNHSASHLNINTVPAARYEADILAGEPIVRAALDARGRALRYYRHPFLFTGPTPEIHDHLQAFLDAHGYRVAPVTLDNADYMFAALYTRASFRDRVRREYVPYMASIVAFFESRSVEVAGRKFPQILLIHASEMNADLMPELLAMFRQRGYAFVTLDEALADPAYQLRDGYVGRGGFSWIHRWSRTMGLPPKGEPDPPAWVLENWDRR
ncbi:MAG: polysaccharide deacetylase family protein [Vicinamibacterales bacterium]